MQERQIGVTSRPRNPASVKYRPIRVSRSMKVLQVSDIHGSYSTAERIAKTVKLGRYDAVFVVGDVTNFGTVEEAQRILEIIGSGGAPVYFVAGNCDPKELLEFEPGLERMFNLNLKSARMGDYDLYGLGGSGLTPSRSTWIEYTEEELREILSSLDVKGSRSLFITHSPPYNVRCDEVGGRHIGSRAIREFVESHEGILLVSCGHVHEARSIDRLGMALVVNAGPARDGYCAEITLEGDHVDAELSMLVK